MRLSLLCVSLLLLAAPAVRAADLVVSVTGVAGDGGDVRVVLIADPEGMARQTESRNLKAADARNGTIAVTFLGLSPGRYGIVAMRDRHVNHAVERVVTGQPSPQNGSSETRVVVAEPSTAVTLALP